jgi:hypothetical protein
MRILTRDDLDGLTCSALIGLHEDVDEIRLSHPQELADGLVEIRPDDIIANLPFREGCALWFDHHMHTAVTPPKYAYKGAFGRAPSAARLVYEYYGGRTTMPGYETLVGETDRLDSADLTLDDILDPQGYIKLGFSIDRRSGLGDLGDYFFVLLDLLAKNTPIEQIHQHPEVDERCRRLEDEDVRLHAALQSHSTVHDNVVLTDFRELADIPAGNRFLVFALFPQINVAMRLQKANDQSRPMLTLGHSIINRTCTTNLGELAGRYGGGGHKGAASIQLTHGAGEQIEEILAELRDRGHLS